MSIIENIIKKVVLDEAIIVEKEQLSPSVYRIRLEGKSIKNMAFEPGYFIRLGLGIGNDDLSMKDKIRSYSIWDIDSNKGTLDVAIATKSKGVGAQWVVDCKVGEKVHFKLKKGRFILDNSADSYLMIGDLSALSHLYIIKRGLAINKEVQSLIYSESIQDVFKDVDDSIPLDFYNLPPNSINDIITIVKKLVPKMKGEKMVYIAGDSRVCIALNQYFRKEMNWETKHIKTKPFWNPEKKGLE